MVGTSAEFYDDDYLGEGEPRRNAEAWLQSHEPYLGQEQAAALRELFARPLIVRDDDSMGFLEFAEVDELVDPVLRYPERHEPILLWDRGYLPPSADGGGRAAPRRWFYASST